MRGAPGAWPGLPGLWEDMRPGWRESGSSGKEPERVTELQDAEAATQLQSRRPGLSCWLLCCPFSGDVIWQSIFQLAWESRSLGDGTLSELSLPMSTPGDCTESSPVTLGLAPGEIMRPPSPSLGRQNCSPTRDSEKGASNPVKPAKNK